MNNNTELKSLPDSILVDLILVDNNYYWILVDRHERQVRDLVRRYLYRSPENVEDVVQETFIRSYRYLKSYNKKTSLKSWVLTIARNESFRFLKTNINKPVAESTILSKSTDSGLLSEMIEDKSFVFDEVSHDVNAMLDQLDVKSRDVLLLRYVNELSYTEISDILKIPTGSVSTLIYRAKKKLQKIMIANQYI